MAPVNVEAVVGFADLLQGYLQEAAKSKSPNSIEPALSKSALGEVREHINNIPGLRSSDYTSGASQNAVIETAVRDVFNELLASESIDQPGFVQMWNLLDIVSILADEEQCDAALFFWLVEELLDSQTIAGCRKVFDYLESRRERTTTKYFEKKQLVILRTCNELLRRLSRAEDTAFCGRVFIFLFQCFPLGDKSSVNLRGEYHVENVTTFDMIPTKSNTTPEAMEIDNESNAAIAQTLGDTTGSTILADTKSGSKSVTFDNKKPVASDKEGKQPLDTDELYPIFWTLQQYFSQPKKLFEKSQFDSLKKGLEDTMVTFDAVQREQMTRGASKVIEDSKRGIKRKRNQGEDDLASAFNPKYLTSRDLFELEISDLSFRRHIAVQALIVLDFMLSLSPKAKEKQATINPQNKSVMYQDQVLSEEDCVWALDMKRRIADYLKKGFEGPFFYRMVETVLSRDKNWVRWKIESCPSIQRPAVSPEEYLQARATIKKIATNKRLRPHPQASLDLKFLTNSDGESGMQRLKNPRYPAPALHDFKRMIADDDFEIEMPTNDETKERAITGKASKSWRALRIASKSKLRVFDKIENPEKIDIIFMEDESDPVMENGVDTVDTVDLEEANFPSDRRPVVISGPGGVGKGTIVTMLVDRNPKVFAKKASHTTRAPRDGEVSGTHYYFVTTEEYNVLRDGDAFLEMNNFNGNDYGTSRKVVESIIASGKIPLMEMDWHGIQQLKDIDYPARYIFLNAPTTEELERRLKSRGTDTDERIAQRMKIAEEEVEHSRIEGFHDQIILNDKLEDTYEAIMTFIHGKNSDADVAIEPINDETITDVDMNDGAKDGKSEEIGVEVAEDNDSAMLEETADVATT